MSRRRKIATRLSSYADVRTMLSAMKSIAMMELHKLGGHLDRQRMAMETVEIAAADFLSFHELPATAGKALYIAIGSERGFCGDFNEELLDGIGNARTRGGHVLLIGSRLVDRFEEEDTLPNFLSGPNIVEELTAVLERVARWLEAQQLATPETLLHVTVLFHDQAGPIEKVIAPLPVPRERPGRQTVKGYPPYLTLEPRVFLAGLMEQAMLLGLREVFAFSLAAENRRRLEHMNNALRRLDERTVALERQLRKSRQEDIIQEIETLLIGNSG